MCHNLLIDYYVRFSLHVARPGKIISGVTRGRTAPGETLQGVTPEGKKLWANLQRIVDKRGRIGKKGAG